VTLINPQTILLRNGRTVPLSQDLVDVHFDGDWFDVTSRLWYDKTRLCKARSSAEDGISAWRMCVTEGVRCALDADQTTLTLPRGIYRAELPITEIVESRLLFVLGFCNAFHQGPSPLICVDDSGAERWSLAARYYGISLSAKDHRIGAGTGVVDDLIDIASGTILASVQSH
jgi:hypothetical protein